MSNARGLVCRSCQRLWPEQEFQLVCPACRRPLEVAYDLEVLKRVFGRGWPSPSAGSILHQWRDVLPIDRPELVDRVTLGEAQTPLIRSTRLGPRLGLSDLRFKIEIGLASASLKDRGTSLCALKALELGYDTLCVASSGNNAASVAAYAAKAGLRAAVFVQRDASPAKLLKMIAHGARVVRVDGDMMTASRLLAQLLQQHRWLNCGGPNPYRMTSKRLVAYEITAQMDGTFPDAVLFPCGGSAGLAAAYMGYNELYAMGMVPRIPRLVGVQLAACDPVTRAFDEGRDEVTPVAKRPSFSDALMNNNPYWGAAALKASRDTGGVFLSVTDDEVAAMIRSLSAQEGLFVEPAAAVAVAGLAKLIAERRIGGLDRVVCTLTGHGLNAPKAAFPSVELPDLVEPTPAAVEAYLAAS
jgi:threonine synthase